MWLATRAGLRWLEPSAATFLALFLAGAVVVVIIVFAFTFDIAATMAWN